MSTHTPIDGLVQDWLRFDQNPSTRSEIQRLRDAENWPELERRMTPRIEFGTAGLRGRMEAGWARMNDLIIIQASQGLCAYVREHVKDAADRGVVVGHDHRHNSERWAKLTASAFLAQGVKVYLHRGLVHTPLVPFSVNALNAACGVMITASHNPKNDNGYKVYWENAVQIIGPHDTGIAQSILANLEPRTQWDTDVENSELCIDCTGMMLDQYFAQLNSLSQYRSLNTQTSLKFVNTSMHGVSHPFMLRAFEGFGLPLFIAVQQQQNADPDFPSVRFPNPEEKGALDLAIATAKDVGAHYVLAQDPDADRFSAAECSPNGTWINFTGDQLGALFADWTFKQYQNSGKDLSKLAMVASTVSSKMVEAMAEMEGFRFVECLTGFKFIGNTALKLVEEGYEVPFGYEEAIGFMFGSLRDKDGVAASVQFAEMVNALHRDGETASSHLNKLYERYGFFQTRNSYFICDYPAIIHRIFTRLRDFSRDGSDSAPSLSSYPRNIAGLAVTSVRDLTIGYDSANPPTYKPTLPLSSGQMIQFRAASADAETKIALTIRTSGTEPKIKYYLEGRAKDPARLQRLLPIVVDELGNRWLEAEKYALAGP